LIVTRNAPPLAFLAALVLGTPAQAQQISPAPSTIASSPSLVVFITVDQLRPDYLERWHDQLTGGLRRLMDGGAFEPNGFQDHGLTETAPGHSATMSGRFPYSTGIASNSAGVNTSEAPLVGSAGLGASPFRFRGTTLADWMVKADPRTRVLSVSRKDRGAILPIGRGKFPVFWYAPASGRFVTSRWYADSLPTWVQEFNAEDRVMKRYAGKIWALTLPASAYPEADSTEGEIPSQEVTFPHIAPDDTAQARSSVTNYPWMDEFTLDLAWRGVRALDLGGGPETDLLAVSLSSTDAVGHRWGPDSRELHDQVLQVDRYLGVFLDSLIALRGADRVVVVLTADHGVAPSPDVRSTWGDNRDAMRVMPADFNPALASVSSRVKRSGIDPAAFGFDLTTLEVDRSKAVGKDREVLGIARDFAAAAKRVKGVLRADVIDDLARADTVHDDIARRWLHTFRPGGDVLVVITLDPFNYFGRGGTATHGSPHDYDARVPIIFWGTPFVPGRVALPARVVDIAPTLARMLGITPVERLDGHVLTAVLRATSP
jgi:predicted AlkP superfamily pyrophosphatase or phosphodiesterase